MRFALVVLFLLGTALALPQELRLETKPAYVDSGELSSKAFVIGPDKKLRGCPEGFDVYVAVRGKIPEDRDLYYVAPGKIMTSTVGSKLSYDIVCLKEVK
jgi:hypothetical protein